MADEAFQNAVQSYYEVFLKSERVLKMVLAGACSQHDFREVFKNNIEKRVRYVSFLYVCRALTDEDCKLFRIYFYVVLSCIIALISAAPQPDL